MAQPRSSLKFFKYAEDFESYKAGQTIVEEGKPGNLMYVVKSGKVDLRVRGKTVETLEPGGIFGEMALLDNEVRSATAVAATDCQLVPIDEKRFQHYVQQTPYFAIEVMRVMAQRLRRMDKEASKG
jgi:CRP/FNR family cyclic AMP-dependent transcriptional regulator